MRLRSAVAATAALVLVPLVGVARPAQAVPGPRPAPADAAPPKAAVTGSSWTAGSIRHLDSWVDTGGKVHLVWIQNDDPIDHLILATEGSSAKTELPAAAASRNTATTQLEFEPNPALAVGRTGEFTVLWYGEAMTVVDGDLEPCAEIDDSPTTCPRLLVQRYSSAGVKVSETLTSLPDGSNAYPTTFGYQWALPLRDGSLVVQSFAMNGDAQYHWIGTGGTARRLPLAVDEPWGTYEATGDGRLLLVRPSGAVQRFDAAGVTDLNLPAAACPPATSATSVFAPGADGTFAVVCQRYDKTVDITKRHVDGSVAWSRHVGATGRIQPVRGEIDTAGNVWTGGYLGCVGGTCSNGVEAHSASTTFATTTTPGSAGVAAISTLGGGRAAYTLVDVGGPETVVSLHLAPAPGGLSCAPGRPTAVPGDRQATVSWPAPICADPAARGRAAAEPSAAPLPVTGYVITPYVGGVAKTPVEVPASPRSAVVTGLTNGTASTFTVAAKNSAGTGPASTASVAVTPSAAPPGPTGSVFVAIAPCRVADTRGGGGALASGATRAFQVSGSGAGFVAQGGRAAGCDIPVSAVAVEASVTAVAPAGNGFFRAWASGGPAATATFLNFTKGQGITNTGAIGLGSGTKGLTTKNFGATAHYVIDVQGYFVAPADVPAAATGAVFVAIAPCRVADTRGGGGALASGASRAFQVSGNGSGFAAQGGKAGGCDIPTAAVAVEGSVTAVAPAGNGFFRAWASGGSAATATFLNFTKGQGITNTGAIGLGSGTKDLTTKNFGATAHYVIDVQGYFMAPGDVPAAATGAVFVAIAPCRVADTRGGGGALASGATRAFQVSGMGGGFAAQGGKANGCDIPTAAVAVETSVTAVAPAGNGFFRAWASGGPAATATFLNFTKGQGITNTGAIGLGSGTKDLTTKNFGAIAHYVIDVQGYFVPLPAT